MYGDWLNADMTLHVGKKAQGGRLIATASRNFNMRDIFANSQTYILTVEPGVDVAMCVLLCIAYDEFNNEGS